MDILEKIKTSRLILDGAMGSRLQALGLCAGEAPEDFCVTRADDIYSIHLDYFLAGSDVATTNTFGAHRLKYSGKYSPEKVISAAVLCARRAADEAQRRGLGEKYVALSLGPTGQLLAPLGGLCFDDAAASYAEAAMLGERAGADLILIETMSDIYEAKAAVVGAREGCSLPVLCTMVFEESRKTMTGTTAEAAVAILEGLGCAAVGLNCGRGAASLLPTLRDMYRCASVPLVFQPNAGLPEIENEKTVYRNAGSFAADMVTAAESGARLLGGCCGTDTESIRSMCAALKDIPAAAVRESTVTAVASYTHTVSIGGAPVIIGERINPTGKPKMKEALRSGDLQTILEEALAQTEAGAHILDVNCGLPELDERATLTLLMKEIQAVCDTPLQLDTSDTEAMETALRYYNGKAMINSVSGKKDVMSKVFPAAAKYGGVIVALTLDENGIPESASGRLEIAEKILAEAAGYGISPRDIVFDALTMAVSADGRAAETTLEAVSLIRERTGCRTVLGVSNVSFGLPRRELVNAAFYTAALGRGLDCAILNPFSPEMLKAYKCYAALHGYDAGFENYISFASALPEAGAAAEVKEVKRSGDDGSLGFAVCRGLCEEAKKRAAALLASAPVTEIISSQIAAPLMRVGENFEKNLVFLPQLMAASDAAKAAFGIVRAAIPAAAAARGGVVLATVKGDIHDIGKNIVAALLESFGYRVTDLGRDVDPAAVLEAARKSEVRLVGLSALMTTTVPAMAETTALLKRELPWCKVVVGGAVLTPEYARSVGADYYAADAMETVRIANEIYKEL